MSFLHEHGAIFLWWKLYHTSSCVCIHYVHKQPGGMNLVVHWTAYCWTKSTNICQTLFTVHNYTIPYALQPYIFTTLNLTTNIPRAFETFETMICTNDNMYACLHHHLVNLRKPKWFFLCPKEKVPDIMSCMNEYLLPNTKYWPCLL